MLWVQFKNDLFFHCFVARIFNEETLKLLLRINCQFSLINLEGQVRLIEISEELLLSLRVHLAPLVDFKLESLPLFGLIGHFDNVAQVLTRYELAKGEDAGVSLHNIID